MLKKLLWVFAMLMAQTAYAAVDANKADQAALQSVKGIGPSVSSRIVDERKRAPFKDWNDFVGRVKGVGEGNATRFSKEGLTVNGASFMPSSQAGKADSKKDKPVKKDTKG